MTLSELSSFITSKLSDTETASVTACKSYINARYRMLWDSCLWTETLGITSKSIAAATDTFTIDTAPTVTFYQSAVAPTTYIDFPVAVRYTQTGVDDGFEMPGQDWMSFFQIDPNAWNNVTARQTTPAGFINLPKDGSGYPRFKPVPVPSIAGTIFVLGKLKFVTLADSDSPCLRGADNALLAFAEGDMLERARQYSKAQAKYAEGAAHLQLMLDIEKGQQASISRIIPMEEGYYCPVGPD